MTPDVLLQVLVGVALTAGGWLLRHVTGPVQVPPPAPGPPPSSSSPIPAPVAAADPLFARLQELLSNAQVSHSLQLLLGQLLQTTGAHVAAVPVAAVVVPPPRAA